MLVKLLTGHSALTICCLTLKWFSLAANSCVNLGSFRDKILVLYFGLGDPWLFYYTQYRIQNATSVKLTEDWSGLEIYFGSELGIDVNKLDGNDNDNKQ